MRFSDDDDAGGESATGERSPSPPRDPFPLVVFFGVLGLLPFCAPLAIPFAVPAQAGWALRAQALYAGLILSFLGGTRFGRALDRPGGGGVVGLSMLPSIVAWVALCAPLTTMTTAVVMAFALCGALIWDAVAVDLPLGYKRLRAALSTMAVVAMMIGAFMARTLPEG